MTKIIDSYKDAFKRYAQFSGVTDRAGYWFFVLANAIISLVLGIICAIIGNNILTGLYGLAIIIPSIAICCRRLRDAGYSPWWVLLNLTAVGSIVVIIFNCMPTKNNA